MRNRIRIRFQPEKNGEFITVWADQFDIMVKRGWQKNKARKKKLEEIEITEITEITKEGEE